MQSGEQPKPAEETEPPLPEALSKPLVADQGTEARRADRTTDAEQAGYSFQGTGPTVKTARKNLSAAITFLPNRPEATVAKKTLPVKAEGSERSDESDVPTSPVPEISLETSVVEELNIEEPLPAEAGSADDSETSEKPNLPIVEKPAASSLQSKPASSKPPSESITAQIDFKGNGTNPNWHVTVFGNSVKVQSETMQSTLLFKHVAIFKDKRNYRTTYRAWDRKHSLKMTLFPGACRRLHSGATNDTAILLTIDGGDTWIGCGRLLN